MRESVHRLTAGAARSRFLIGIGISVVVVLLLLGACGGGDGDGDKQTASPGQPSATQEATSPLGLEPAAELLVLAEAWASQSARVSYDFVVDYPENTDEGTFTLYWKPPDWQADVSRPSGISAKLVVTGDDIRFCQGESLPAECPSAGGTPPAQLLPLPFLEYFVSPKALSDHIVAVTAGAQIERSLETIAGERAACYSNDAEDEDEWCFTIGAIPVRLSETFSGPEDGRFRLEAVQMDAVSDADIQP